MLGRSRSPSTSCDQPVVLTSGDHGGRRRSRQNERRSPYERRPRGFRELDRLDGGRRSARARRGIGRLLRRSRSEERPSGDPRLVATRSRTGDRLAAAAGRSGRRLGSSSTRTSPRSHVTRLTMLVTGTASAAFLVAVCIATIRGGDRGDVDGSRRVAGRPSTSTDHPLLDLVTPSGFGRDVGGPGRSRARTPRRGSCAHGRVHSTRAVPRALLRGHG